MEEVGDGLDCRRPDYRRACYYRYPQSRQLTDPKVQ
jgi:hypothetical protein